MIFSTFMGTMKNVLSVSEPNVYARFLGAPVLHPLVAVIHYDEVSPIRSSLNRYGVYALFIQRNSGSTPSSSSGTSPRTSPTE